MIPARNKTSFKTLIKKTLVEHVKKGNKIDNIESLLDTMWEKLTKRNTQLSNRIKKLQKELRNA